MKVSAVIACKNEEQFIANCVNSILKSFDFAGIEGEVFVYDGHSDDHTLEKAKEVAQSDQRVKVLINELQTAPNAFNLGIERANGELIMIFGAHATMDEKHIAEVLKTLDAYPDVGCVGGLINNIYSDNTGRSIGAAMNSPVGVGNATFRTGGSAGYVDTVAFGAYKREVFEKVGLFNSSLTRNQDDEFNFRVIKGGYRIAFNPKIKSDYYVRSSLSKLWSQYYQYGYWKVYVNQLHSTVTSARQLVPFGLVSYTLLFIISTLFLLINQPSFILILALPLSAYIGLVLAVSIYKSIREKVKFATLVGSFFILHFSYGLGYLFGIINFLVLKKKPSERVSKLTR